MYDMQSMKNADCGTSNCECNPTDTHTPYVRHAVRIRSNIMPAVQIKIVSEWIHIFVVSHEMRLVYIHNDGVYYIHHANCRS